MAGAPALTLMSDPIRILHLEDSMEDASLVHSQLQGLDLKVELHHVKSREEFTAALNGGRYDLILSDYSLPSYNGTAALELASQ